MLLKVLQDCVDLSAQPRAEFSFSVNLWMSPSPLSPSWQVVTIPKGIALHEQQGEDLGERMNFAASQGFDDTDAVIVIGSDCPEMSPALLRWAATALQERDACLVPCADGGYALIGMRSHESRPVSYTHLTLPTIYSV